MDLVILAQATGLLRLLATAFMAVGVFGIVISLRVPGGELIAKQEKASHEALSELFLFDVTPRQLTYLMATAAAVGGLLGAMAGIYANAAGTGIAIAALTGIAAGYFVPRLVLFVLQKRRQARLNEQLIDGLVTLANGMRAGLNLVQSMKLIESNAEPPISQEFGLMLREFEHGTSVDEVLRRASARIKLHHYKLMFAALETARSRGGNLPDTLDRLGESLREIVRLEEKVRAMTAQNRMSAIFMCVLPIVIVLIFWMIEPEFIEVLFHEQWGMLLLGIAATLLILGYLWMRKIATFEI